MTDRGYASSDLPACIPAVLPGSFVMHLVGDDIQALCGVLDEGATNMVPGRARWCLKCLGVLSIRAGVHEDLVREAGDRWVKSS